MKALLALAFLTVSFQSQAFSIQDLLDHKDVVALEKRMEGKSFQLASVVDVYASKGVRPRCPCESYELKFVTYKNGEKETKKVPVSVTGFGQNIEVRIQE